MLWSSLSGARGARHFATNISSKAVVFSSHGNTSTVLRIVDQNVSSPSGGQVLVRMLAAPVNPSDINTIQGVYGKLPNLPAVAGNEGVGVVEQVGSGVKDLAVGDRVIPSQPGFGTWRTHAVGESSAFTKVDSKLPIEYASVLAVNPCTAYRLLSDFANLQKGDVIVQNAANSLVGQAVIQIAAARGIRTINLIRPRPGGDQMIEYLKQIGGDVVMTDELASSHLGRGVLADMPAPKLAINAVGGESSSLLVKMLGENGELVTIGGMARKPVTIPAAAMIFKNITARGFWMSNWVATHSASERTAMLNELTQMMNSGKLKLLLERRSFSDALSVVEDAQGSYRDRKLVMMFE